jgi:tRNA G10  N-methylase Trm11
VDAVVEAATFKGHQTLPKASIVRADCRNLPFDDEMFDYIITSPPYLNAIDYLRGHKLSLVWLGSTIADLRKLRSSNVGCDGGTKDLHLDGVVDTMVTSSKKPSDLLRRRVRRYVGDLDKAIGEMRRVAKLGAQLVMVVGDSTIKGCDIQNSIAVDRIAHERGFELRSRVLRPLLHSRRYLPPPSTHRAGSRLQKRMWNEIILTYRAI